MAVANLNFTDIVKPGRSALKYSTGFTGGNRFNDVPLIVSSTAKPAGNAPIQIIGSFVEDGDIVIRTNGTFNFGDAGPNVIMYLDATKLPLGTLSSAAAIYRGAGVTLDYQNANAYRFNVVNVAGVPGGKAIENGAPDSALNSTNSPRLNVQHAAHTRGFESRCLTWPQANQDLAQAYVLGQTGPVGTRIWQEKGIWNMANFHFGGIDTNFFYGGPWRGFGEATTGGGPAGLTSNSLLQVYGIATTNPKVGTNMPRAEPTTYEYTFDQYAANERALGYILIRQYGETGGVYVNTRVDNIQMCMPNGAVRYVDSFTYPGFMRGYNVALGMNRYDSFIYKANGAGACCRVLLTNHSDYKQATKVTILLTTANNWARYEITSKVRSGWFNLSNLTGVYLNIVGADNNQIASKALG